MSKDSSTQKTEVISRPKSDARLLYERMFWTNWLLALILFMLMGTVFLLAAILGTLT